MYFGLSVHHIHAWGQGDQKKVSGALEQKLQVVVSHLIEMLVTELRPSARSADTLNL